MKGEMEEEEEGKEMLRKNEKKKKKGLFWLSAAGGARPPPPPPHPPVGFQAAGKRTSLEDGERERLRVERKKRNYINYIYRVKQLYRCKKTDSLLHFRVFNKKNRTFSETESIL